MEDQARFRRHRGACPFYRENWVNSGDEARPEAREIVLYETYLPAGYAARHGRGTGSLYAQPPYVLADTEAEGILRRG